MKTTCFTLYIAILLLFTACSSTKNWQGSSTPQMAQADFKELNGTQNFVLRVPTDDTYLSYRFTATGGELKASVKSASGVVFTNRIESSEEKKIHLVNQKGATYQVSLAGKQASGTMDVKFVSTNE